MKKNLDRTGLKNVTTYNAKVDQYGPAIERYNNELLPDPVRRRYTFNAKAQRYNGDCANRAAS